MMSELVQPVSLGYVDDLYALLGALELMPPDSVLHFEGTSIAKDVRDFLAQRSALERLDLESATLYPAPQSFDMPLNSDNLRGLLDLAERHAEPEVCDHLAVYQGDTLLLVAHDAGFDEVVVSRRLPAPVIEQLAARLLND